MIEIERPQHSARLTLVCNQTPLFSSRGWQTYCKNYKMFILILFLYKIPTITF